MWINHENWRKGGKNVKLLRTIAVKPWIFKTSLTSGGACDRWPRRLLIGTSVPAPYCLRWWGFWISSGNLAPVSYCKKGQYFSSLSSSGIISSVFRIFRGRGRWWHWWTWVCSWNSRQLHWHSRDLRGFQCYRQPEKVTNHDLSNAL